MVKNKYPKNRKKADYGSMNCMECGDSIIKQVNNMKYCKECRIIVTKRMMKKDHIKRWKNKEFKMLNQKSKEVFEFWKMGDKEKVIIEEIRLNIKKIKDNAKRYQKLQEKMIEDYKEIRKLIKKYEKC